MRNQKYLTYETYQKCYIFVGEVRALQDYFTYFELNQSLDGTKTRDPSETPPDHPQAELDLSHI